MKELSEKELSMMAAHWCELQQRPPEKGWHPSEMSKRVPYNELPEAGAGALFAEAIRGELGARGWSEDVSFSLSATGSRCMNCGRVKPEVSENGGWCSRCEGR